MRRFDVRLIPLKRNVFHRWRRGPVRWTGNCVAQQSDWAFYLLRSYSIDSNDLYRDKTWICSKRQTGTCRRQADVLYFMCIFPFHQAGRILKNTDLLTPISKGNPNNDASGKNEKKIHISVRRFTQIVWWKNPDSWAWAFFFHSKVNRKILCIHHAEHDAPPPPPRGDRKSLVGGTRCGRRWLFHRRVLASVSCCATERRPSDVHQRQGRGVANGWNSNGKIHNRVFFPLFLYKGFFAEKFLRQTGLVIVFVSLFVFPFWLNWWGTFCDESLGAILSRSFHVNCEQE